jgi:poly [ADP-ribose] polymerase 6/8
MSLPDELALSLPRGHQFMAVISEPESEEVFRGLVLRFQSKPLWHGSGLDRWHSIVRTGLKNATGTNLQAHGSAHGPGIYFATQPGISTVYAHEGVNGYARSALGQNLTVLALCEVATVPHDACKIQITRADGVSVNCSGFLNRAFGGGIYTCTMEEAVVVRILLVTDTSGRAVGSQPTRKTQNIPTLADVLTYRASHGVMHGGR